jgi:hypothetical protein
MPTLTHKQANSSIIFNIRHKIFNFRDIEVVLCLLFFLQLFKYYIVYKAIVWRHSETIVNCEPKSDCQYNSMDGVTVSVFASPIGSQTKYYYYNIGICCFSAKHTTLRRKCKDGFARNQPSGATFLSADCCFSRLAL